MLGLSSAPRRAGSPAVSPTAGGGSGARSIGATVGSSPGTAPGARAAQIAANTAALRSAFRSAGSSAAATATVSLSSPPKGTETWPSASEAERYPITSFGSGGGPVTSQVTGDADLNQWFRSTAVGPSTIEAGDGVPKRRALSGGDASSHPLPAGRSSVDARAALDNLREQAEGETAELAAALRAAARREEMLRGTVSAQLQVRA